MKKTKDEVCINREDVQQLMDNVDKINWEGIKELSNNKGDDEVDEQ